MISIAGVIGTGLFLGTASALMNGGPLGLLLAYIFVGSISYCVMITIGEMISYLPIAGGHIKLAERFVDPAFSFALGWNLWYNWTVTLPAELSAAATIINFWHPGVSNAVWITMCLVVAIGINMSGVGVYGETEFILRRGRISSIKVVTIVGLIIFGIILDLGGGPNHDRIGFRYWKDPGPFVQFYGISGMTGRFLGWSRAVTQAAFAYSGLEVVAMAAAESKNPRKNLPKAIRRVYIRILLFYIGGVFVIGLLVPSNNPLLNVNSDNASASPFVIAINQAGIKGLPSVINAALLTSAWSAASSNLYISSRGLHGLAASGNAPKVFLRTSRSGLPYVAVAICASFSLLAYMAVNTSSGMVFTWFSSMCATAGLTTWFGIGVIYLRFRKGFLAQGHKMSELPYSSRFQPFAAWWAIGASLVTLLFSAWEVFLRDNWSTATFMTNYLPMMLFPVLYVGAKIWKRIPIVKPNEMDFHSGIAEIEAMT
ncbi:amino acid permease/ SLC12A domain-containing protein [Suillus fuscotomentosus]|uniref:Amino acid permease/ SLC12A domain-containing protein n=1 Tax=Suillus fuscotomentosus TaxID=1912939 RepID=A0AAD4DYB8_9AGAM|nr:amino acid permease/ SLC12A domain-containing protein [Suillus fuscotomentosus]KAG1896364.1 amino acid permease/ SLC12A domain-containing protein [Suillus fuscotomentosus]